MDVPPEHTPQFAVTDGSRSSIKRQAKEMGIGDQACPSRLTWRGSGPKRPPHPRWVSKTWGWPELTSWLSPPLQT